MFGSDSEVLCPGMGEVGWMIKQAKYLLTRAAICHGMNKAVVLA